jgi:hypothetical protein
VTAAITIDATAIDAADLDAALAAVPERWPDDDPAIEPLIDAEVAALASAAAADSLARDTYWPKWDSPWWQMALLDELGRTDRIPTSAVTAMVAGLAALPSHGFPIDDADWPPGVERWRAASCHCAIGTIDRVLARRGVAVDEALPWIGAWYPRYQLADGGYTCDEAAYRVTDECPSSMVGTLAPLEALVERGPSATADRAAAMVLGRGLRAGSATRHNAEERDAATTWPALCFPRAYFYDTLRGLAAVTSWATRHQRTLPVAAIAPVVLDLTRRFSDGVVVLGRAPLCDRTTWAPAPDGGWHRRPAALTALAAAVSVPGTASPPLTRQWTAVRRSLRALAADGRLTA